MGGEAKRDYPASIGYQSPWYKKYSYIEDHFARVNTALTRGKPVCRIAVIHPIETLWINCGPNDKTSSTRMHRDLLHKNLTEWLLFALMDFDFIAESLLPELYEESECGLKIGEMSYDTVIVPDLQTIRRTTLEALKKFREKGGKVIFAGQIPSLVDAEPSEEAKAFALTCENVNFDKMSILNALEDERLLDITDARGYRSENLIYNMRADGDSRWLFVANALGEGNDGTDILKERISNNYSYKQLIIIKIKGEYEPTLYDTVTGEIKKASFEIRNGVTYIPISRYNLDSILLKLDKPEKTSYGVAPSIFKGYGIKIPSFVEYEREEPNVLLVDYAEHSLDGGEYSPAENILRLDNYLRKRLGYPLRQDAYAQPWAVEKEEISHYATLRFKVNTETELEGAMLALENANDSALYIDGEKETAEPIAFVRRYMLDDGRAVTNPQANEVPHIVSRLAEADNTVRLLRFRRKDTKDIALVNFSTHPDVVAGYKASADWPGFTRRFVEGDNSDVNCIFFTGAQGDSNHLDYIKGTKTGYEHSRRMGRIVADAVAEIWDKTTERKADKLFASVSVIYNKSNTEGDEKYEEAVAFEKARAEKTLGYNPTIEEMAYARRIINIRESMTIYRPIPVAVIGIGEVVIAGFAGEAFTEYGAAVRDAANGKFALTFVLTNGSQGYLPSAEAFAQGGYEAKSSHFTPELESQVIAEVKRLIDMI